MISLVPVKAIAPHYKAKATNALTDTIILFHCGNVITRRPLPRNLDYSSFMLFKTVNLSVEFHSKEIYIDLPLCVTVTIPPDTFIDVRCPQFSKFMI